MFVFELNGNFDALLDMDLASAEIYAMRRFVFCGEKPCYRSVYDNRDGKLGVYIQYGTTYNGKHSIPSFLKEIKPKVILDGEWEVADKQPQMLVWYNVAQLKHNQSVLNNELAHKKRGSE
jgi:hypothetical protein